MGLAGCKINLFPGKFGRAVRPLQDVGQHSGFSVGWQGSQIQVGAHAPKMVQSFQHGLGHERLHRFHRGAGLFEQLCGAQDSILHLGLHRQATARFHQQTNLETLQKPRALIKLVPRDGLKRQAHAVTCIGL